MCFISISTCIYIYLYPSIYPSSCIYIFIYIYIYIYMYVPRIRAGLPYAVGRWRRTVIVSTHPRVIHICLSIYFCVWPVSVLLRTYEETPSPHASFFQFQLNDSTEYFWSRANEVLRTDYVPSSQDVLRARVRTTGVHIITVNMSMPFTRMYNYFMFHEAFFTACENSTRVRLYSI